MFHADGRTDMTKLIVAFHNFANAPKKKLVADLKICENNETPVGVRRLLRFEDKAENVVLRGKVFDYRFPISQNCPLQHELPEVTLYSGYEIRPVRDVDKLMICLIIN